MKVSKDVQHKEHDNSEEFEGQVLDLKKQSHSVNINLISY